jgi:hypothetical protein
MSIRGAKRNSGNTKRGKTRPVTASDPFRALAETLWAWRPTFSKEPLARLTNKWLSLHADPYGEQIIEWLEMRHFFAYAKELQSKLSGLRSEIVDFYTAYEGGKFDDERVRDEAIQIIENSAKQLAKRILEIQCRCRKASQLATNDTKEQPWADDAPEYLFLTEAKKLIDGQLSLQTLGRLCKPDGKIRYMHKGHRCKIHAADFREHMKSRQSNHKMATAYMNWLQGQKAGKNRLFWKCQDTACAHEYPEEANATSWCPKCKGQCAMVQRTAPKLRR